eukprot:Rhum_TRINITY_DN21815_c0_g1::Rhum_TRINITY_DN21815_c0_g1_i1::g.174762::m.174762
MRAALECVGVYSLFILGLALSAAAEHELPTMEHEYMYGNHSGSDDDDDHGGISHGGVFLIVFFVFFFVYMGLGIAYNALVLGKRGINVIPNLKFWKGLPALVGDGVRFCMCKKPADAYQSIN